MGHFYYKPKMYDDKALGYYIKIMGYYNCIGKKPITIWSDKIYPSERHIVNCFAQTYPYYFKADKQIVCCVYDTCGHYKFSLVRDPKTGKINRIDDDAQKVPIHMRGYQLCFEPGHEEEKQSIKKSKAKK